MVTLFVVNNKKQIMKNTYIKTKDDRFPITNCTFYADCVKYMSYDEWQEEFVIPNGEWELIEEEVVINTRTLAEQNKFEKERSDCFFKQVKKADKVLDKLYGPIDYQLMPRKKRFEIIRNRSREKSELIKKYMNEKDYEEF